VSIAIQVETPPIREDESGVLRVGRSRLSLETVIHDFQEGASPEAIVQHYPTLSLSDVYGVVAYYLRHRDEVERYLAQREQLAREVQQRVEAQQPDLAAIRLRLRSRCQSQS
jgi:uncharacterized protein (DUF433 family)